MSRGSHAATHREKKGVPLLAPPEIVFYARFWQAGHQTSVPSSSLGPNIPEAPLRRVPEDSLSQMALT